MIYYITNPELSEGATDKGYISLSDGSFICTAKITNGDKANTELYFEMGDDSANKKYGFSISTVDFDRYTVKDNLLITEPFNTTDISVYYFDEEFRIKLVRGIYRLYKKVTNEDSPLESWGHYFVDKGVTFAYNTDDKIYTLIKEGNTYRISKNIKNAPPPLTIKTFINDEVSSEISFKNNIFYIEDTKWYKFIISEGGKLISIWRSLEDPSHFEKIKTLSYPGGLERAYIKLGISESMHLSNMSFSFFKTDVE